MKTIIRLTESELHGLISRSVKKIIKEENEYNNKILLNTIAQCIASGDKITAKKGFNDTYVMVNGGEEAYIGFTLESDPYLIGGIKSSDRDVPDDADKVIDNPTVYVESIKIWDDENEEEITLKDDGTVAEALENMIEVDYTDDDLLPYSRWEYYD